LKREWRPGDRIELELPRQLQLQAVDSKHPNTVALVYGPLVLFMIDRPAQPLTRQQLLSARRPDPHGLEWHVNVDGALLRLVPYWSIEHQRYSTYLTVTA
jgi:DUF1680 family protein